MFRFNKGFNITIIVLSFIIVSATAVLISIFPNKFELIFGTGTFLFVSFGMFVSLQSLDTATGARADSEKSADATVASAESAYMALQLAMEEAVRAKERYRIENSSLLKIHKGVMNIPIVVPFTKIVTSPSDDAYSKENYSSFLLKNSGVGTASSIDVEMKFINAPEFENFKFSTKNNEETTEKNFMNLYDLPQYKIEAISTKNERHQKKIVIAGEDFIRVQGWSRRKIKIPLSIIPYKSTRIGALEKGDEFTIPFPVIYRTLAHQFFLESLMIDDEKARVTPNPRLRVRVTYTEEILEHMNDHEEAKRLKEFEISCYDGSNLISLKEKSDFKGYALRCYFNVQSIFDRPLSELLAEELMEEETTEGSTGTTN